MGQQRAREEKSAEIKAPEAAPKKAGKWKGKDWFFVLAPQTFGEKIIAQTPTMDPRNLKGRVVEASATELTGNRSRYYMKFKFKIDEIEGKNAKTVFNEFIVGKDFLARVIRKKSQKVRLTKDMKTSDGWGIQMTITSVLNRNTDTSVRTKVRNQIGELMSSAISEMTLESLLSRVIAGVTQKGIRKQVSKLYPVKFFEVERIEIISEPAKAEPA